MASLRLVRLRKVFSGLLGRERVAVDDLDLEVRDQEFVTLVGPSGCGKTTTLRMIAGLERPTRGEIYFGPKLVNDLPPQRRNISMVFQNYAIFPHMTVRENLGYGLRVTGVARDDRERRVLEGARLLRIDHLLDHKPGQLSGGERQRVALGRSIVRKPQVFLLDEPLSNLDAKLRDQMRVEIKRIHLTLRTTMIYVTHDQLEAMSMSDRIAVMNEGRVLQFDSPHRVFNEPLDRFVAQFIGSPSMNFFPGVLEEEGGILYLQAEGFRLPVGGDGAHALARKDVRREVEVGIRPQVVGLTPNPVGALAVGEVFVLEPVGTQTHVHVKVGSHTLVAVADSSFSARIGEPVGVRFQGRDLYLLDPVSGRTLLHGL